MRIRRYQDSDYEEVWALHNLALEALDSHPGNGPWDDDLHKIKELHLDDRGGFLVGVLLGSIVAMGALNSGTQLCTSIPPSSRSRRSSFTSITPTSRLREPALGSLRSSSTRSA